MTAKTDVSDCLNPPEIQKLQSQIWRQVKLYVDSLIWAMKHEQPQVGVLFLILILVAPKFSFSNLGSSFGLRIYHQKLWELIIS